MKQVKKVLLIVFAICSIACLFVFGASAETYSGKCGENAIWEFDTETGSFTISGSGYMYDYNWFDNLPPWETYKELIKNVKIFDGIRNVGSTSFSECSSLVTVELSDSIEKIGEVAFHNCVILKNINIPNSLVYLGSNAFYNCFSIRKIDFPYSFSKLSEQSALGSFFEEINFPNGNVELDLNCFRCIHVNKLCFGDSDINKNEAFNPIDDCFREVEIHNLVFRESISTIDTLDFSDGTISNIIILNPNCKINPDIEIPEYYYIVNMDCNIVGLKGSTAEAFAKSKNYNFIPYDEFEFSKIRIVNSSESTCTENGYTGDIFCDDCISEEYTYNKYPITGYTIPALGHELIVDNFGNLPTCTSNGITESYFCTRCNYKLAGNEIPIIEHKDNNNDGYCDDCNKLIKVSGSFIFKKIFSGFNLLFSRILKTLEYIIIGFKSVKI